MRQKPGGTIVLAALVVGLLVAGLLVGSVASAGSSKLVLLTSGANLSGTFQWTSPSTIVFQSNNDLFRVTLAKKLTKLDGPGASLWFHAVSPDGTKIVYATFQPDISVRTLPISGGTPFEVVTYGGLAEPDQAIWRTDGQQLAYTNDAPGGEIDTVSAGGGSPTVVMPGGNFVRRVIAYDASGRLIVQQTDRSGNQGKVLSVTEAGVQTVLATDAYTAVASRDGATIAYSSGSGDLYSLPAAGGTPIPLGVGGYAVGGAQLAFSPDGSLVAVAGVDLTFSSLLGHVAQVDGSGAVRLPYGVGSLGWAPDGSKLALDGRDLSTGIQGLATVHPDGTNLTKLVRANCGNPVFSPDGARVACADFISSKKKSSVELAVIAVG